MYGWNKKLLGVYLQVGLNQEEGYSKLFDQFLSENIETIQFNFAHYISNEKGFPIFNKVTESMLVRSMKYNNVNICIEIEGIQTNIIKEYRNYLCYVFKNISKLSLLDDLTCFYDD